MFSGSVSAWSLTRWIGVEPVTEQTFLPFIVSLLVIADSSLEMLALNHEKHPDCVPICCPTEHLPFPDERFDVVFGNNTFYLVPDMDRAAVEIGLTAWRAPERHPLEHLLGPLELWIGDETAKAWLFGSNAELDSQAPAYMLRQARSWEDLRSIVPAARAFARAEPGHPTLLRG